MKKILVTGGAGYIGSHTVVELQAQGYCPIIVDNFANSKAAVLERIQRISGSQAEFERCDLLDSEQLDAVFANREIDGVIHFAGLKAVGESSEKPLLYYHSNLVSTLNLLNAMQKYGVHQLVFSSSCTVYGNPTSVPVSEDFPRATNSPYGQTKLMIEEILIDLAKHDRRWQFSLLRYFNPVAAHPSGLIGEDPNGIPNNLMPYISQVAVGKLSQLAVFGNDYPTIDGTGVRDYIHVVDLAMAHISALQKMVDTEHAGCAAYNIGTGEGYSVLQMVDAFEQASGKSIPYAIQPRREGDIDAIFADPSFSHRELDWSAKFGLQEMMRDQWNWQSNNPKGYE